MTSKVSMKSTAFSAHRPNDYIYDPIFTVSSAKDYHKAAIVAAVRTAKYGIMPNFSSMFSNLKSQPSANSAYIQECDGIPKSTKINWSQHTTSTKEKDIQRIEGSSRFKFFYKPSTNIETTSKIIFVTNEMNTNEQATKSAEVPVVMKRKKACATQTIYRESSAQTSPWEPPYIVMEENEPEILTLEYLSWTHGLPVGMHEVEIIERARIKRAWDKLLSTITDEESLKQARINVAKIEANEWEFREREIETIHDLRLQLAYQLLNNVNDDLNDRAKEKIMRSWVDKQKEKQNKIAQIRHDMSRALRKLTMKKDGIVTKYHPVDIIDEHIDLSSELYGPLMRHGEHPKRRHEKIPKLRKYETNVFDNAEQLNTLPTWLYKYEKMKCDREPSYEKTLCAHHTKWTHDNLEQLHLTLKNLRMYGYVIRTPITLRKRKPRIVTPPLTPRVTGIADKDEIIHQASIFLQKIIKGRAAQSLIYEGRDKCRELIEEIKSTHALQEGDWGLRNNERVKIRLQQRATLLQTKSDENVTAVITELYGGSISTMLDFLNKELVRLREERKAHAFAMYVSRERYKREAAEAGRRQLEERRRKEHDEIFKQITKVHQDTVDLYLENIISESMNDVTEEEAKVYIKDIADKIDQAANEAIERNDYLVMEEITADLVQNFLLPEVEKEMIRKKIRSRQQTYMKTAHDLIYNMERQLYPKEKEIKDDHDSQTDTESCHSCECKFNPINCKSF